MSMLEPVEPVKDLRGRGRYRGGIAGRVSREIVTAWADYVAGEIRRFDESTGQPGMSLWLETPRARKAYARLVAGVSLSEGAAGVDPGMLAAFSGAWHTVAPHVVPEFRQWVDEGMDTERLTLSQFAERFRADERRTELQESAAYALRDLELLAARIAMRDDMIRDAHLKGAQVTEIARAIGMSRQAVHGVINRVIDADERARLANASAPSGERAPYAVDAWAEGAPAVEWVEIAPGQWVDASDIPF